MIEFIEILLIIVFYIGVIIIFPIYVPKVKLYIKSQLEGDVYESIAPSLVMIIVPIGVISFILMGSGIITGDSEILIMGTVVYLVGLFSYISILLGAAYREWYINLFKGG